MPNLCWNRIGIKAIIRPMLELPPLSLYIHIPWCVRKCPYCDFNSHEAAQMSELPEQAYLAALEADLSQSVPYAQNRKLESIFFGGGTPSVVSSSAIKNCIKMAGKHIGLAPDAEITLEANPGTFEQEKFRGFRDAGVNRLSIGIQSFNQKHLTALGRIHNVDEAKNAYAIAREAGFENINLDLMHGLPNQTLSEALLDLEQAIALEPNHISWYELTLEPNTEFYSRPPKTPSEDEMADITEAGMALLASAGYERYEISAYARDKEYCQHNINYWEFGDYLGIGAGAHEKITILEENSIIRRSKTRLPKHYMERIGSYVASENQISASELPFEFCMNALRLTEGVSTDCFLKRTGMSLEALSLKLAPQIDTGLVHALDKKIQPTNSGTKYLNSILESLLD